jgi:hypothetical protein
MNTKTYHTHWHIRVDDLSESQYLNFKNNAEYTKWMVIGNCHSKDCYGKDDERNGRVHYHVVLKYNQSREKSVIVNKFILKKNKGCDSYYCEAMYAKSNEAALIRYVSDKECGFRFVKGENLIKDILFQRETEEAIEENDNPTVKKKTKEQLKAERNELRLAKAKECDWNWFEENDFEFLLSPKFAKLYERYNIIDMNIYNHLTLKGNTKQRFLILYGESRKGKGAFTKWLSKVLDIPHYQFNKTDSYFNGCPSDTNEWLFHIDEWDGTEDCKKNMPVGTIKEIFDKEPKKVRAAYCFDKVMRFGYGTITMQVHPKRGLFVDEKNFIEENYLAIKNRFSIINVLMIPDLFSLTFNLDEERWEQKELKKVPEYLTELFPHLVDHEGFPIYKETKFKNYSEQKPLHEWSNDENLDNEINDKNSKEIKILDDCLEELENEIEFDKLELD